MPREDLMRLIHWTMLHYGSDAQERAEPGSKLRSQVKHIVDVIEEFDGARARLVGCDNVVLVLAGHGL